MKRRDFLIHTAGVAGASTLAPVLARAGVPCPPPSVSVQGGQSVTTACAAPGNAEADWLARSTAPGVVWAHDFRSDAEVNNFRWDGGIGDDPKGVQTSNIHRLSSDGIQGTSGGCLEIVTAAGTQAPGIWWRMLSPLTGSGNGRGSDDPGASGTLAPQSFAPNANYGGSNINSWGSRGVYGPAGSSGLDGSEFYLQMRTKISASRYAAENVGTPYGYARGKLVYLSHTYRTLTSQEIVVENRHDKTWKAYRSGGAEIEPALQSGSDIAPTLFKFTPDEWLTQLIYVKPGAPGTATTIFRVWVARPGQTSYTKIWDSKVVNIPEYEWSNGFNAIALTSYMNGDKWPVAANVRHTQLIFSKQPIPCPHA